MKEMWNEVKKSFACEIDRESRLTWIETILGVVMFASPVLSLTILNEVVSLFGK